MARCWSVYVFRNNEKIEEFHGSDPDRLEQKAQKYIDSLEDKSGITTFTDETTDKYYDPEFEKV